jgi:hypothetical protein
MNYCYDASGFIGMSFQQNQEYKTSWATFNRIQTFDSNVSTLRFQGSPNLYYYNFINYAEKAQYSQGQFLHYKSIPYLSTLWVSVQRN